MSISEVEERLSQKSHWVPDKGSPKCNICGIKFSVTKRKHHCRHCGQIYCQECTFRMCKTCILTPIQDSKQIRETANQKEAMVRDYKTTAMNAINDTKQAKKNLEQLRLDVDMQRARSQIDTQRVLATKNTEIAKLQQTIKEQSDLITQYTSQVPSTNSNPLAESTGQDTKETDNNGILNQSHNSSPSSDKHKVSQEEDVYSVSVNDPNSPYNATQAAVITLRQELRALTKLKDKETNLRQTQDTLIVQLRTELSEAHQQVAELQRVVDQGQDQNAAYQSLATEHKNQTVLWEASRVKLMRENESLKEALEASNTSCIILEAQQEEASVNFQRLATENEELMTSLKLKSSPGA